MYKDQRSRIGGDNRKFSKMVELVAPQYRTMLELLEVEFAQNGFFKVLAAPSTLQPILSFKTSFYIKFDHIRLLFSKFRHFRKFFTKMTDFYKSL